MLNYGDIIYKQKIQNVGSIEIEHNEGTANLSAILIEEDATVNPNKIKRIVLDSEDPFNKIKIYFTENVSGRIQIVQAGPVPVVGLSVEEKVELSKPASSAYEWDISTNKYWWKTYTKWIDFTFVFVNTPEVHLSNIQYQDSANLRVSRVNKKGFEVKCEAVSSWDTKVSFVWTADVNSSYNSNN
jgi:hypothetical protein